MISLTFPIVPLLAWVGGSLIVLAISGLLIRELIRWARAGGINPMSGMVEILSTINDSARGEQPGPTIAFDLNQRRRNRRIYTRRNTPQLKNTPFTKIEMTNGGDAKKAGSGTVNVSIYGEKGKLLRRLALSPGNDHPTEFYRSRDTVFSIWKDPGSTGNDATEPIGNSTSGYF